MQSFRSVPEEFGTLVFNEDTMQRYVSAKAFAAWRDCIANGNSLPPAVADEIADAMKAWAIKQGVTHFTHWFQPMTGFTAEKHDSFIYPISGGRVMMDFSGKELVRGEPDASSFPSGGLRATFEARGYTAWDPTSFAFIKDGSLCIPTVFFSYSGEALDKKAPLLRSLDEVGRQTLRILRLFGDNETTKVTAQVGAEQEYFLIDKELFDKRDDLRFCGRTLFGAMPPKGQDLDDHYFGAIRTRVAAYMKDLDETLWRLGVFSKTKHNEVAPSQHEMAPIYSDVNTASDHNQLTMEMMKKVADRHGLVCLLHEKPFACVNGSGKHNNWSLNTNTGKNLFSPGKTPGQNAQFLLLLAAFIKGVDEYQEILRCTVASAGNDHRLGASEAPPAILSIFLGDELSAIVDALADGTEYIEAEKKSLEIGVDVLPYIPKDTSDRNRTSPIAFTRNKFEFRMLGASQSIAGPNIALNTIMAEELSKFATKLEAAEDFQSELHELICETFREHKRIIFNGNGYDASWIAEAESRGLRNLSSCADALPTYVCEKNVELFTRHNVLTKTEMFARHEIHLDNYVKVLKIEAQTMLHMLRHQILPAVSAYSGELCRTIIAKQQSGIVARVERELASKLSELNEKLFDATNELLQVTSNVPSAEPEGLVRYYHDSVLSAMERARVIADELENITASEYWPYPTYSRILFSV